ncbi:unnamed protein product [Larinioides sclopetarius]|uniref:Ionotropic glutamate receptor L-glutamate and glycine-binding domain-containing protein n=1 Tax=Larinioides sclopetarius TaxID=280406 RepID=A0AAV1ZUX0_9ARAC
MTVGFIPNKYIFETNIIKGTLQLGGIEGRFLDLISKVLGFTCHLKSPLDREIGTLYENGSWTGLIGMLQRKEADMALNFLVSSEQRSKAVIFSDPYEMSDIRFLVDKPGVVPAKWSVFYPFDITTWASALFIVLTSNRMKRSQLKRQLTPTLDEPVAYGEFFSLGQLQWSVRGGRDPFGTAVLPLMTNFRNPFKQLAIQLVYKDLVKM